MRISSIRCLGIALATDFLLVAPCANAQRSSYQQMMDNNRLMFNRINRAMVTKNMCEEWKRKGETVPAECSQYVSSSSTAPAKARAIPSASLRFSPAGDATLRTYADNMGKNAEERQQMLQILATTKSAFEQQYAARGWKNNVAGAYAFFIGSIIYVWSDKEPDEAAQNRLFEALTVALAESPDMAKASNQDKAALYDTLIASTSLPLVLYVDGSQNGNQAQMEQARKLAAEYSRKIMQVEPEALVRML